MTTEQFNIIASVCSIISLAISLLTYRKVSSVEKNINRGKQKQEGNKNQQAGGNININQ
jgi:hypothetical protein